MLRLQQEERLQKYIELLKQWLKVIICSWMLFISIMINKQLIVMKSNIAQTKIIKAQKLVIVDNKNKPRIEFITYDKVCGINLYDSMGNKRIELRVNSKGNPSIKLNRGKQEIGIGVSSKGSVIGFTDTKGDLRILLSITNINDKKTISSFIFSNEKKEQFVICAESNGMISIRFFDTIGKLRIGFGVLSNREPDLRFFDEKGRVIFKIP